MFSVLALGLCLVGSSNIGSVKSSEIVQRSLVVLIGERVELKCSVTGKVASWKYLSWNSSTETNIYLGRDDIVDLMRSRYKIDKRINGQHNLLIDYADFVHAGRYRCTGVVQSLQNYIQLLVFGSYPVCSGNTSEVGLSTKEQRRHLSIWCSINYTGNGIPVFNWTKSNAENIALNVNATNSGTRQGPFTSTSLITQQLQANDSEVTFYCLITFQTPNISPENAFNVFAYTWNYTLYGPRNFNISDHVDRLECSADGNPAPMYTWTNVETNMSINGSAYTLNLTNNKEHTLYCTAENILAFVRKNYTIKGRVTDSGVTSQVSNSPTGLMTLAVAIAGSLLVLLIIIIIVARVVYRKRPKGSDGPMNSDNAVYTDVCKPKGSDGRKISDNAVYAEVCKPKGPSKGSKGSSIGDNSPYPQHPTLERKDHIGDDGTEYVNMGVVKSTDRKGVRHVPDPPDFSQETIYTSIDHSGRVPAHLPKW